MKQIDDTRLIEIRFKHADPQVAAKVINAIADAFAYSNLERKTETSDKAGDFLQKRIIELQSEIRRGEETLINYAKNHQIISLDASQNTVVDRLSGLNKQLMEAENDRKLAEAAYRASQAPGAAEALAESGQAVAAEAETKLICTTETRPICWLSTPKKSRSSSRLMSKSQLLRSRPRNRSTRRFRRHD